MIVAGDNRVVVLLKSLRTNNRFYTLVSESTGLKNADAIGEFPPDLLLGIAYPCLEDGLNDFAVIRTTFETIDVFPDDDELRTELMGIIADARGNLLERLLELRDGIVEGRTHFLGTVLQEFKDYILHIAHRGAIRRTLDNMMKLDVFDSVAKAESANGRPGDPMYRYEFLPQHSLEVVEKLTPRAFIGRLFDDVIDSVTNDANYTDRYRFDKHVFQKFVAVMFTNYATTDPVFYGTSREDYGVSSDKDMNATPLYQAVAEEMRRIERELAEGDVDGSGPRQIAERTPLPFERTAPATEAPATPATPAPSETPDLSFLFDADEAPSDLFEPLQDAVHTVEIPFGAAERLLMNPLSRLREVVRLLRHLDHPRANEVSAMTVAAASEIFDGLQELKIISPLANDPMEGMGGD